MSSFETRVAVLRGKMKGIPYDLMQYDEAESNNHHEVYKEIPIPIVEIEKLTQKPENFLSLGSGRYKTLRGEIYKLGFMIPNSNSVYIELVEENHPWKASVCDRGFQNMELREGYFEHNQVYNYRTGPKFTPYLYDLEYGMYTELDLRVSQTRQDELSNARGALVTALIARQVKGDEFLKSLGARGIGFETAEGCHLKVIQTHDGQGYLLEVRDESGLKQPMKWSRALSSMKRI